MLFIIICFFARVRILTVFMIVVIFFLTVKCGFEGIKKPWGHLFGSIIFCVQLVLFEIYRLMGIIIII